MEQNLLSWRYMPRIKGLKERGKSSPFIFMCKYVLSAPYTFCVVVDIYSTAWFKWCSLYFRFFDSRVLSSVKQRRWSSLCVDGRTISSECRTASTFHPYIPRERQYHASYCVKLVCQFIQSFEPKIFNIYTNLCLAIFQVSYTVYGSGIQFVFSSTCLKMDVKSEQLSGPQLRNYAVNTQHVFLSFFKFFTRYWIAHLAPTLMPFWHQANGKYHFLRLFNLICCVCALILLSICFMHADVFYTAFSNFYVPLF